MFVGVMRSRPKCEECCLCHLIARATPASVACLCTALRLSQESLPFAPEAGVMAAVAASLQALRERRRAAAAGRQRLVAAQSAARCAVAPLLGRDALAAARVLHPVAHVHVVAQQVDARACLRCVPSVRPHCMAVVMFLLPAWQWFVSASYLADKADQEGSLPAKWPACVGDPSTQSCCLLRLALTRHDCLSRSRLACSCAAGRLLRAHRGAGGAGAQQQAPR